jgi:hypothetical protein
MGEIVITKKVIDTVEKLSSLGHIASVDCVNCPGYIDYNEGLHCHYTKWKYCNSNTAKKWLEYLKTKTESSE